MARNESDVLINIHEAGDILHCKHWTVRQLVKAGKLRPLLLGGRYKFYKSEVEAYRDQQRVRAKTPTRVAEDILKEARKTREGTIAAASRR